MNKVYFSRHGVPDADVSDNGTQYVSEEFHEFSISWKFNHVIMSPLSRKANGKEESLHKIVKQLFKKAH